MALPLICRQSVTLYTHGHTPTCNFRLVRLGQKVHREASDSPEGYGNWDGTECDHQVLALRLCAAVLRSGLLVSWFWDPGEWGALLESFSTQSMTHKVSSVGWWEATNASCSQESVAS